VKKVLRVLPDNPNKKKQVFERVGHSLGLLLKPKAARTSATIPAALVEKVQKFYTNNEISWPAPGKRDTKTVKENGINVKYQKQHLLYSIREVYELQCCSKVSPHFFVLNRVLKIRNINLIRLYV
jgi:hypothetical protein